MDLLHGIEQKNFKLVVWGLGYIGITTAIKFAEKGIECLGIDINQDIVNEINKGNIPLKNISSSSFKHLVENEKIKAIYSGEETCLDDYDIHIICVNTDANNEPFKENLLGVFNKIINLIKDSSKQKMVIIESTISPNWITEDIVPIIENQTSLDKSRIHFGVSPRRDWFINEETDEDSVPRIVGLASFNSNELGKKLYEICYKKVLIAENWIHAAMVKIVENAIRYLNINFSNQLAAAFPDLNITEILQLSGTKWNIPEYHPSLGIGGYCIPLAPKYLLEGAKYNENLNSLLTNMFWEEKYTNQISEYIFNLGVRRVGILGLSYAPNIKVHKLSPAINLFNALHKLGVSCMVSDPLYTEREIRDITGAETFDFNKDLNQFDLLLVVAAHKEFYNIKDILDEQVVNPIILDNLGDLKSIFKNSKYKYHEIGNIRNIKEFSFNN
ncbi:nucleotide sugar dehydrogenase [Bacillus wiedmannii]|uniref:nucleotide sugar dehydrogenase n=1 Tax=Bacillus wiedmannii TaxID=1890302 RepID=UPI000BF6E07D|nr:nucleotide sugar dehydrogenase [Bacillus wiedmannii]PFZ92290.1 hypothetical protein COL83_16990 [Bacillus wiedmannii]